MSVHYTPGCVLTSSYVIITVHLPTWYEGNGNPLQYSCLEAFDCVDHLGDKAGRIWEGPLEEVTCVLVYG